LKEDEMGGSCGTNGKEKCADRDLVRKPEEK
jgi:hypothetical protein